MSKVKAAIINMSDNVDLTLGGVGVGFTSLGGDRQDQRGLLRPTNFSSPLPFSIG
jgi:hypothetical protein